MIFKCKICGGTLLFNQGEKTAICEYCGREQTLPCTHVDEKIAALYERANSYRLVNEFDKAANIYNQIIVENASDAEAYWNLALCNYGVVYVKDPKTLEYIPTCNRTQHLSILHDENYKNALQYAAEQQKPIYEKDARYINEVQKSIIAIAKNEKPFDIFICYKETTVEGKRTKDSIRGQELYEKLTAQGYKVFFARITLESKIGIEYEPYIYAALASSKVMIHITSSGENSNAAWVKNEWGRYLALTDKNRHKTIIPIYFNMEKTELPEEFENVTSYNMDEEGFEQELIRGIKKLIPLPIMKAKRRKKARIVLSIILAVLIIVAVITIPYVYKFYQYEKVMELYDAEKYDEAAKGFAELSGFKDADKMQKKSDESYVKLQEYKAAMQLYYDKQYPQAAWAFAKIETFKDSKDMKKSAEKSWRLSLATVAMDNLGLGEYYVTANGSINVLGNISANAHDGIKINEHGKIVSIATNTVNGDDFWALYEDGYIATTKRQDSPAPSWGDVIQISRGFCDTHIALRSDGTMVYERIVESVEGYPSGDEWLDVITEWKNVVAFDTYVEPIDNPRSIYHAAVIALTAEGKLYMTSTAEQTFQMEYEWDPNARGTNLKNWERDTAFIEQIENVKTFAFCMLNTFEGLETNYELNIIVLTQEGELVQYPGAKKLDYEGRDILSLRYTIDGMYALKTNGEIVLLDKHKVILTDVVYMNKMYAITRAGTIYKYFNYDHYGYDFDRSIVSQTTGRTKVYNEWIERLE